MAKRTVPTSDPNAAAFDVVAKANGAKAPAHLTPDHDAAEERWPASVRDVDERGRALLRAAFEAGADAANSNR